MSIRTCVLTPLFAHPAHSHVCICHPPPWKAPSPMFPRGFVFEALHWFNLCVRASSQAANPSDYSLEAWWQHQDNIWCLFSVLPPNAVNLLAIRFSHCITFSSLGMFHSFHCIFTVLSSRLHFVLFLWVLFCVQNVNHVYSGGCIVEFETPEHCNNDKHVFQLC